MTFIFSFSTVEKSILIATFLVRVLLMRELIPQRQSSFAKLKTGTLTNLFLSNANFITYHKQMSNLVFKTPINNPFVLFIKCFMFHWTDWITALYTFFCILFLLQCVPFKATYWLYGVMSLLSSIIQRKTSARILFSRSYVDNIKSIPVIEWINPSRLSTSDEVGIERNKFVKKQVKIQLYSTFSFIKR